MVGGDYKCEGFIVSVHHSSSQKNAEKSSKKDEGKNPKHRACLFTERLLLMKLRYLEEPPGFSRGEISQFLLLFGDPAHADCVSLAAEVPAV